MAEPGTPSDELEVIVVGRPIDWATGQVWDDHKHPPWVKDALGDIIGHRVQEVDRAMRDAINNGTAWEWEQTENTIKVSKNLLSIYNALATVVKEDPPDYNNSVLRPLECPLTLEIIAKEGPDPVYCNMMRVEELVRGIVNANECWWAALEAGDNGAGDYQITVFRLLDEFAQLPKNVFDPVM